MQIIQTLCDLCYADDIHQASDGTNRIEINGRAIEIDLCNKHKNEAEENFSLYYKSGRRPDRVVIKPIPKSVTSGNFPCTVEGCTKSFDRSQGLAMHKTRTHALPGNRDPEAEKVILRDIDGESVIDRKRRRDRERYHLTRAAKKAEGNQ